jgi:CHAD domain-containing protein
MLIFRRGSTAIFRDCGTISFQLPTSKYLSKSLGKRLKTLEEKLSEYLSPPNPPSEEKIHDLRTSIRRLQAQSKVLPKSFRKKDTPLGKYLVGCKSLFKQNTKVRDIDIIRSKINRGGSIESLLIESGPHLDRQLARDRDTALSKGMGLAKQLKSLPLPEISEDDLSNRKMKKSFSKIVGKLERSVAERLPKVLKSEKDVKELHLLRKDCKMLRYTLELEVPQSKKERSRFEFLADWQDALGSIHDSDIALQYLSKNSSLSGVNHLIEQEQKLRHEKYVDFVKSCVYEKS